MYVIEGTCVLLPIGIMINEKPLPFQGKGLRVYVHLFGYVHVGAPPDSYPHQYKGTNYIGNKA